MPKLWYHSYMTAWSEVAQIFYLGNRHLSPWRLRYVGKSTRECWYMGDYSLSYQHLSGWIVFPYITIRREKGKKWIHYILGDNKAKKNVISSFPNKSSHLVPHLSWLVSWDRRIPASYRQTNRYTHTHYVDWNIYMNVRWMFERHNVCNLLQYYFCK